MQFWIEFFESTLRLSTPLIFAAMGGFLCERSGIATICLEGVMLTSAFTAAVVNYYTQNPWLALCAALIIGALTMSVHAFLTVTAKADQIVSGIAVNLFAAGVTPIFCKVLFNSPTSSASIPLSDRFSEVSIPLLSDIPFIGPVFFHSMPLVYIALLLPFALHFLMYRTGFGLRILSSGDGPEALTATGVSLSKTRYLALLLGGLVTSLGGTYLSISHASQFTRDMTSGRGFIALAALIFGKWRPIPALFSCLFFGLTEALQIRLQGMTFMGTTFPVQFIQALPYAVTLITLILFFGTSKPPRSVGRTL